MVKKLYILAIIALTTVLLAAGCGSTKAITTSTPPPSSTTAAVTTSQAPTSTTSTTPTTTAPPTSITLTTTTQPPTSTTSVTTITSNPPTSAKVYVIAVQLQGPAELDPTVKVGTTVRWTQGGHDDRTLTLVSDTPGLFGGVLSSTPPYVEYTFNAAGTYWYGIKEMPDVRAKIIVIA